GDQIAGLRRGLRITDALGGEPVLTVAAVVVAAQHAEGERLAPGHGVEEGLLLDGIDLQGPHVTMGNIEDAAFVVPDFADAAAAGSNQAAMSAGEAGEGGIGVLLIKLPLPRSPAKHVGQGQVLGHEPLLPLFPEVVFYSTATKGESRVDIPDPF